MIIEKRLTDLTVVGMVNDVSLRSNVTRYDEISAKSDTFVCKIPLKLFSTLPLPSSEDKDVLFFNATCDWWCPEGFTQDKEINIILSDDLSILLHCVYSFARLLIVRFRQMVSMNSGFWNFNLFHGSQIFHNMNSTWAHTVVISVICVRYTTEI